jgi:hypothetical protein
VKTQVLLAASAAMALSAAAIADDVKIENGAKCTTTETANQKKVVCIAGDGPKWDDKSADHVVIAPPGGGDVEVQVFNDGKTEKRIVMVRRGMDSADENKDGKVTRKEFMARAEKHFGEMDKNKNGALEGEELKPPMPPMPHTPGVAPLPPVPPVPPAPPAPPAN